MVRLIIGAKGKGKTTVIHDRANAAMKDAKGSVVYIDRNSKHMYELSNKIRLIDISQYPIKNSDQFVGFICGITSQDHDIEELYLDGFLDCAKTTPADSLATIRQLDDISSKNNIKITISLTADADDLPDELKSMIDVAL
ncbi:MAG: twitching motility protein PilT [Lachnospiraceae bacterium]|jgi:ABC-type cobalamin/Fe3+-siderophores transport system ATPase subunit